MRTVLSLSLLLGSTLATGSAGAQDASVVTVELSNFRFAPSDLSLHVGRPYRLRLVNTSSGSHDFKAPAFFAASAVAPASAGRVAKGAVDLRGRESVEIDLVPRRPGHFSFKCTHFLHAGMGMNGHINVT